MAGKATKAAKVLLGSAALAAMPDVSHAVTMGETEPTNTTFPGQAATAGVTYQGFVSSPSNPSLGGSDYFHYTGLTPGSFFDVFVEIQLAFPGADADIFATVTGNPSGSIADRLLHPGESFLFDNLIVPDNGEVVVGLSMDEQCCEGYNIRLDANAASVDQPAALALVTAGLVGLGLQAVRRRRAN